MEPTVRLARFWNWLPAFRVVAETQHLPTAAERLHISPSALSRTIRLLEEHLEQPLFERVGRNLVLNPAGRQFLDVLRRSMREVHNGYEALTSGQLTGEMSIAASGPFSALFLLPALESVCAENPNFVPVIRAVEMDSLVPLLKRGDLDLALVDDPISDKDLENETLIELTHNVFCGPNHVLAHTNPTVEEVTQHAFVAPIPIPGPPIDGWPSDIPRNVALRVTQLQVAIDACKTGRYLAALPDLIGHTHGLVSLPGVPIVNRPLQLVRRAPLPSASRADHIAESIRTYVQRVHSEMLDTAG